MVGAVPDLSGVPGVHDLTVDGSVVSCTVEPEALPAVLTAITGAGVRTLTSTPPTLEELFLDAYRRRRARPMTGLVGSRGSRCGVAGCWCWSGWPLLVVTYASAAATGTLYASAADQVAAARAINASPALVALYGPILDVHSLGEVAMTKMTVTYAVFVMAFAVTLVRRHTRVEEESGRAELLGGLAVEQSAPLLSAVLVGVIAAVLVAVVAAGADIAGGLPVAGSLWFAGSWLGLGLVGTGIGAVAAQLSASARTCGAIAAGASSSSTCCGRSATPPSPG